MIPQCSVWFAGGGGWGFALLRRSCHYPVHVILTKVRIQGYERCGLWLWILTFVRLTRLGGRARLWLWILTFVRMTGGGRALLWLWILTFVRMTRVGDGCVCGSGS